MEKHMMSWNWMIWKKKALTATRPSSWPPQEARFINDQVRLGIVKPEDKPTTMALKRLFEGRVIRKRTPKPKRNRGARFSHCFGRYRGHSSL